MWEAEGILEARELRGSVVFGLHLTRKFHENRMKCSGKLKVKYRSVDEVGFFFPLVVYSSLAIATVLFAASSVQGVSSLTSKHLAEKV